MAGPRPFCRFSGTQGGTPPSISVDLKTLVASRPTLAALAYLEKPGAGRIPGNVNPASIYHSQDIVRGADLTGRFRCRPSRLPNVFG